MQVHARSAASVDFAATNSVAFGLSVVMSDISHSICVRRQRCEGCVSDQGFGDEKA